MRQSTIDSFYETISCLVITDTISKLNESLESSKRILKKLKCEKNLTLSQVLSHVKVENNNDYRYNNNINKSDSSINSNFSMIHNTIKNHNNGVNYASKRPSSLPSTSITNNKNTNYHRFEPYHQNHRDFSNTHIGLNHRSEFNSNMYNADASMSDEYIIENVNLAMTSSSKLNRIPTLHHLKLINNANNNINKYMSMEKVEDDNDEVNDENDEEDGECVGDGDNEDDSIENLDDSEDAQTSR